MDTKQFTDLIRRRSEGKASPEEEEFLTAYYRAFDARPGMDAGPIRDQALSIAKAEIDRRINNDVIMRDSRPMARVWWAAAAVIIAVLSMTLYLYNRAGSGSATKQAKYDNDIDPASKAATLTLADGRELQLSGNKPGVILSALGTRIIRTGEGKLVMRDNTANDVTAGIVQLSTSKAQTYQVILEDGTIVKLNAGSSLKFPTSFAGQDHRRVELLGEGYFEVAKDPAHPFIVHTQGEDIRVLGTHFDVHAYSRAVTTTLIEGKVEVSTNSARNADIKGDHETVVLSPGQQAIIADGHLKLKDADMETVSSWKNDQFIFKKAPFPEVMQQVAYWYDVEIIYQGKTPAMSISGVMGRQRKLSAVLDLLEMSCGAKFKIQGRRVYVIN